VKSFTSQKKSPWLTAVQHRIWPIYKKQRISRKWRER